eukprot:1157006-Pelagomonas_calceolata.AAC.3
MIPHTLEPLKDLGLGIHTATMLALKLHAMHAVLILSSKHMNSLAPVALLRRLLSTLIIKIRHGLLLVTLLIPIDFFLMCLLMKGIHAQQAEQPNFLVMSSMANKELGQASTASSSALST